MSSHWCEEVYILCSETLRQVCFWTEWRNSVKLTWVPEFAEVRLPQSRWKLSGCAGRGWSSLEIPAEKSVYVVPMNESMELRKWFPKDYMFLSFLKAGSGLHAGLELLNYWPSCLYFPSTRITSMHYHVQHQHASCSCCVWPWVTNLNFEVSTQANKGNSEILPIMIPRKHHLKIAASDVENTGTNLSVLLFMTFKKEKKEILSK